MTKAKKKTAGKSRPSTPAGEKRGNHLGSGEKKTADVGIKKQYLKTRDVCKVTFRLPGMAAREAEAVCLLGEFNDWDLNANPMKKLKCGDFTATVELPPGRAYQFRYLIDRSRWENDWNADGYVKTPYGDCENSVVIL